MCGLRIVKESIGSAIMYNSSEKLFVTSPNSFNIHKKQQIHKYPDTETVSAAE